MSPLCAVLCIHTSTHYHNNFSSFITPQPPPPPPFPFSMLDWWLRQQPSAVRYSWLSSPPGRGEKGGIYQNCADSALSVVAFFIIRRTTLLSCQKRQLNIWQLQGVWFEDNVRRAICFLSLSVPYTYIVKIVYTSDRLYLAPFPARHMCEQICYANIFSYIHMHICCSVFQGWNHE